MSEGFLNQLVELMKKHDVMTLSVNEISIIEDNVFIKDTKVIMKEITGVSANW